jgi:hypothetical protein
VPRDPLALALLWDYQDGYLAGIPTWLQRGVLGGLAGLARLAGYQTRWLKTAPTRADAPSRNHPHRPSRGCR